MSGCGGKPTLNRAQLPLHRKNASARVEQLDQIAGAEMNQAFNRARDRALENLAFSASC
jgi:hypothetical protein